MERHFLMGAMVGISLTVTAVLFGMRAYTVHSHVTLNGGHFRMVQNHDNVLYHGTNYCRMAVCLGAALHTATVWRTRFKIIYFP
jgi:hypothetical protein